MQKSSQAAANWFPKSTVECIGLMLNAKTNADMAGDIGLVSGNYHIRYAPLQTWKANQPPQAISLAVMNRIFLRH